MQYRKSMPESWMIIMKHWKKMKSLDGDTNTTTESAKAHQDSAAQALKGAQEAKATAEAEVREKEKALEEAKKALTDAGADVEDKEKSLSDAQDACSKIEAGIMRT